MFADGSKAHHSKDMHHFVKGIIHPIYKRREQDRIKDIKIESLNEPD